MKRTLITSCIAIGVIALAIASIRTHAPSPAPSPTSRPLHVTSTTPTSAVRRRTPVLDSGPPPDCLDPAPGRRPDSGPGSWPRPLPETNSWPRPLSGNQLLPRTPDLDPAPAELPGPTPARRPTAWKPAPDPPTRPPDPATRAPDPDSCPGRPAAGPGLLDPAPAPAPAPALAAAAAAAGRSYFRRSSRQWSRLRPTTPLVDTTTTGGTTGTEVPTDGADVAGSTTQGGRVGAVHVAANADTATKPCSRQASLHRLQPRRARAARRGAGGSRALPPRRRARARVAPPPDDRLDRLLDVGRTFSSGAARARVTSCTAMATSSAANASSSARSGTSLATATPIAAPGIATTPTRTPSRSRTLP